MRRSIKAQDVKDSVSIQDLLNRYGIEVNSHGFAVCPFHDEKTASMKIYQNGWMCYGCHKGGSVIDFYMNIHNLSFSEAVNQLGSLSGIDSAEIDRTEINRVRALRVKKEQKILEIEKQISILCNTHQIYWKIRRDSRPGSPEWVDACDRTDRINYELEVLECKKDQLRRSSRNSLNRNFSKG